MTIDTLGGNVVDGIGTKLLEVIVIKINGGREKPALSVILVLNAGLHLFSRARAVSGRRDDNNLGRKHGNHLYK